MSNQDDAMQPDRRETPFSSDQFDKIIGRLETVWRILVGIIVFIFVMGMSYKDTVDRINQLETNTRYNSERLTKIEFERNQRYQYITLALQRLGNKLGVDLPPPP